MNQEQEDVPSVQTETQCIFVSTVGLSLMADHDTLYFGRKELDYKWNTNNNPGDLVYVRSTHLMDALISTIDEFENPISIIINGDDCYFPYDFQKHPLYPVLLGPKVLHVFAQNCWVKNHPKFHAIPIGLDYHTLNWHPKKKHQWGNSESAIEQERRLMKCMMRGTPFAQSDPTKIITNFQSAMNYPERRKIMREMIYNKLKHKDWMTWLPQQPREEFWDTCGKSAFVLCPPGNGPDTHRAWEAMIMGRVAIIQDLSINSVYEDLPVWIVKDWDKFSQQTPEDLKKKHQEFVDKWNSYKWEKLTLRYWADYMHSFKQK